jgi:RNA polymerase sigma-70 factor, ECF subfamily
MLLQEFRRAARTSPAGELILLDDQDRSRWNRKLIAESGALVERALSSRRFGPYTLHGGERRRACRIAERGANRLAADHRAVRRAAVGRTAPVVELNRAVAVAMRDGPQPGLSLIDAILPARG